MSDTRQSGLVVVEVEALERMIEACVRRALGAAPRESEVEWLDAREAAALLRVHPRTVARLVARGELPAGHAGRALRFKRSDLDAYLARQ